MDSTSAISGLASGIDWKKIIDQLIELDRKKVKVIDDNQFKYKNKLDAWKSLAGKLQTLKTSATSLKEAGTFNTFTSGLTSSTSTSAANYLNVSVGSKANSGVYNIVVSALAKAQKTSSTTFTSKTTALGYSGEFLINGKDVKFETTDTLVNLRDKINNKNTGSTPSNVTANILSVSSTDNRLVLTSDKMGADGFSILDASSTDVIQSLGFTNTTTSIKTSVSPTGAKSDKFSSSSTAVGTLYGLTSSPSGTVTIGDKTVSINLGTQSLTDIKTAIDAQAPTGVTTTIESATTDGVTTYRLKISGTNTFTDSNNVLEALGILKGGLANSITAGQDAGITVDGITMARTTNTITDAIEGVTLNLVNSEATTTLTLTVSRNIDAVKKTISNYTNSYNEIIKLANEQFTYDTEKKTAGVLSGDVTLTSVQSDVRSVVAGEILGLSSTMKMLSNAGISIDSKGLISIDDTKLTEELQSDFNAVKRLFIYEGTATNSKVEYISHTKNTKAGTYEVYLTTAASQGTVTGSGFSGTYTDDATADTIKITDKYTGRIASVSLNNGDSTSTIVNAINSELATEYTQVLTGSVSNSKTTAAGGGYISATTKWSEINTGGDANNITDGSTIAYSGTKRGGASFSGSYTITSATTKTVGEFLSELETEFGNNVTAAIDSNGKISITDNTAGDSKTSLTLTENAGSLDFGTVSVSTTGRNTLDVIASSSGNNLVITNNQYGSTNGFTISYVGGGTNNTSQLGITAQEYTGTNVAGTINGETATGSGQDLIGNSGNTNTDGLSLKISYSSSVPASLGTLKLTLGVAEQMEKKLNTMLDTVDGYVTYRQTGLQSSIENFQKQMDTMDERLTREREKLTNQFLAMEKAISKVQNMSNWLTKQLSHM
ncbi:MAG: flagellar filament capping protein FliD [Nitrospirae bacterium]|nr:flagellar filament capping protein FliD [Nitrospirota bacterium]